MDVVFHGGSAQYSNVSENARETIITNFRWTITDGGLSVDTDLPGNQIRGYSFLLGISVVVMFILFRKIKKRGIL
jgi:hypothetical protein